MTNHTTLDSFKGQAKKLHAALRDRGVALKLSDVQESLAVSLGHRTLAALYATLKQEDSRYVDAGPLHDQPDNHFVVSWEYSEEAESDEMVVYPPGTIIDDIATRDWRRLQELNKSARPIPEHIKFDDAVVFENFAEVSNISKYGLHDGAHESTIKAWILEHFYFRVPKDDIVVHVSDRGDDGASKDHFLLWVPDAIAAELKALFN
jgi:hypothetical protein